jgi:hypothetical protein
LEENLAVLIDFENIAAGTEKEGLGRFDVEALMGRLKDKGRILVSRSYGDWGRFARFKQELLTANVTMMELTSHGMQDKNRADIAMVVDCLELAFTRQYVDTFVIVSGDSDFTPLVLKMRELNKRVIGVGTRGSTSRLIINACDEFIFYDSVVKARPRVERAPANRKLPQNQAKGFELLVETVNGLLREDPTPQLASIVKTALVRRTPDFSEEDLGFSSFARFLEAARDAGLVSLTRDQKSGGYRVVTAEDDQPAPAVAAAPAGREAAAETDAVPEDAYYPPGSEAVLAALATVELSPLAAPTRMALLEALVDSVKEREEKRRRVQISFAVEDIKRKLRRTHPDLSARTVKDVLLALLRANQLMHKDGTSIRSPNASFTLTKTADQLNKKLTELYLRELKKASTDLSNVRMLAELFFGDPDRRRDVETALAWASAAGAEGDADDAAPARADEDDLFVVEGDASDAGDAGDRRRGTNRRRGGRGRDGDRGPREGGDRSDRGPRDAADAPAAAPARPRDSFDDLLTFEDGPRARAAAPASNLDDALFVEEDAPARPARSERRDRRDREDGGGRRDDGGGRRDDGGGRRGGGRHEGRREDRAPAPPLADDLFLVEDDVASIPSIDDLLLADEPAVAAEPAPAEPEPVEAAPAAPTDDKPARKPRAPRGKKAEAAPAEAVAEAPQPAAEEAPAAEAEEKPKRRSPRKKKEETES